MNRIHDAGSLRALLAELGRRLTKEGIRARLYVVGGGAMLLKGVTRDLTEDVDAKLFSGKPDRVRAIAREIARDFGVDEDWLSGAAEPYLPPDLDPDHAESYGGLDLETASDRHLLAMKLVADRPKDRDDIARLIRDLDIRSEDELVQLATDVYGKDFLEAGLNVLDDIRLRAATHLRLGWRS